MSLISEGLSGRGREADPRMQPAPGGGMRRAGTRAASNALRASQARAALRREARRDEQAVAHWLRELARPQR
jgi:hypothetical protein